MKKKVKKTKDTWGKLRNGFMAINLMYFIWIIGKGRFKEFYMIWNIILCWIPFELSLFLLKDSSNKKGASKFLIVSSAVLWILFLPNCFYIITDFIHISGNSYMVANPNYKPYVSSKESMYFFSDNISIWYDFFSISLGVFIGLSLGVLSLYIIQRLIEKKYNKTLSWISIVVISFISGYAIYLGRFLRWNSWDLILKPMNIINMIIHHLNSKSLKFAMLFGTLNLVIYILVYMLINVSKYISSEN